MLQQRIVSRAAASDLSNIGSSNTIAYYSSIISASYKRTYWASHNSEPDAKACYAPADLYVECADDGSPSDSQTHEQASDSQTHGKADDFYTQ
mmetsp:Transcript_6236/g.14121  ORF Transcript_6236/g.14121 Transcript_6236/m.14121 type:complete len:93 (+) Transcript_6236:1694-1972(+)